MIFELVLAAVDDAIVDHGGARRSAMASSATRRRRAPPPCRESRGRSTRVYADACTSGRQRRVDRALHRTRAGSNSYEVKPHAVDGNDARQICSRRGVIADYLPARRRLRAALGRRRGRTAAHSHIIRAPLETATPFGGRGGRRQVDVESRAAAIIVLREPPQAACADGRARARRTLATGRQFGSTRQAYKALSSAPSSTARVLGSTARLRRRAPSWRGERAAAAGRTGRDRRELADTSCTKPAQSRRRASRRRGRSARTAGIATCVFVGTAAQHIEAAPDRRTTRRAAGIS